MSPVHQTGSIIACTSFVFIIESVMSDSIVTRVSVLVDFVCGAVCCELLQQIEKNARDMINEVLNKFYWSYYLNIGKLDILTKAKLTNFSGLS